MARIIARKFRAAGYPDPLYKRTKPGPLLSLDASTDKGAYILGILWGAGSKPEVEYIIRHRDPTFLRHFKDYLQIDSAIQQSYSRIGDQYRIKISRSNHVNALDNLLSAYGWTQRSHLLRYYPTGDIHSRGFVRAWVELHSAADIHRTGRKRTPRPRLRIYGNEKLILEMNRIIAFNATLEPRSIQNTTNEITKALYYYGASFRALVDWLYTDAELFNSGVREKFMDILSG